MKKGLLALGLLAVALFFYSKQDQPSPASKPVSYTAPPTLEQSLSDFKDSMNDLDEAVGEISDGLKDTASEIKDGVESIAGQGSVSRLLDGGNSFAFDCAEDWFLTQLCAELEMTVDCLPYEKDYVECREKHQKSEYEEIGNYSEYWVGLVVTLADSEGQSLTDIVMITIQLSEDNWGTYLITAVEDAYHIFDLEIGRPIIGTHVEDR